MRLSLVLATMGVLAPGAALAGGFTVDSPAVHFPDTTDFTRSQPRVVTLTNGAGASVISRVSATWQDGGVSQFVPLVLGALPLSVAAGGTAQVEITFEPFDFGPQQATVVVEVDGGRERVEIAASGSGLPSGPIEPKGGNTEFDLGSSFHGIGSAFGSFEVRGARAGGVVLREVVSDRPEFIASTPTYRLPQPLALGESVYFSVAFNSPAVDKDTAVSGTVRVFIEGMTEPAITYHLTATALPGERPFNGTRCSAPSPAAPAIGGTATLLLLLAGPVTLLARRLGRRRRGDP